MKKEAVVSGETALFGAKTDDQEVREKAGKLLFTDHGWTQVKGNGSVMLVNKYVDLQSDTSVDAYVNTIDKAMSEFKKAAKKSSKHYPSSSMFISLMAAFQVSRFS